MQVGDPFMEKLLMEACLEVMKTGALVGIQDMGAAGLTCSTSEMGSRGGHGMDVDVMHVPQRETGMTPYEIMLSESQERMLMVVHKGREREVESVFEKWDLHAVQVGVVTEGDRLRIYERGTLVADVPNRALTDEAPVYRRPMQQPGVAGRRCSGSTSRRSARRHRPQEAFDALIASPDHRQQALGVPPVRPHGRHQHRRPAGRVGRRRPREGHLGRARALRRRQRPLHLSRSRTLGGMLAVAEAARNVACAGGEPIGATNNLNFGNPERPEIMWQFGEAVRGIGDACRALEVPITGGNVSLYNETEGRAIFPTPVLGVVGLIGDVTRTCTRTFKQAGRGGAGAGR